jgi:hypothetical protein
LGYPDEFYRSIPAWPGADQPTWLTGMVIGSLPVLHSFLLDAIAKLMPFEVLPSLE